MPASPRVLAVSVAAAVTAAAIPAVGFAAGADQQPAAVASVKTGASKWQGPRLRHPEGGRFDPKVERWANLVSAVMAEKNIPQRHLEGVLAQIQQESSGNPKAVNRWDVNARRGTPSKGLLQVIKPTYRAYAKKGYRHQRYMTVPYTNIYAALSYVEDAYGRGKFVSWGRGANQGY